MYCKKCGWKLNETDRECPFCHAPVNQAVSYQKYQPIDDPNINDGIKRDVMGYEDVGLNGWGHAVLAVGMYFAYQLLAVLLTYFCIWTKIATTEEAIYQAQDICTVISEVLCIGIFVYLIRKSVKPIIKKFASGKTWKAAGITFALMYAASFVYNIILMLFNYTDTSTNQSSINMMIKETPVLAFLFVCILAPLIEEIIFRFGLFRALTKINDKIAILLTTFVFAFMHMIISIQSGGWELFVHDLPSFPAYLIGAFAFTFAYYKTKNIATPMCAHFINNTFSFLAILLVPVAENPGTSELISNLLLLLQR